MESECKTAVCVGRTVRNLSRKSISAAAVDHASHLLSVSLSFGLERPDTYLSLQ